MNGKKKWTREETLLALELYLTIPAEDDNVRNPQIVALASALGRTASSVRLAMQNFKACDPSYLSDGRVGLNHTSQLQVSIAKEFIGHPSELFKAAAKVKEQFGIAADQ